MWFTRIDRVNLRVYTRFMKPSKCHCTNLRTAAHRITRLYDEALEGTGLKVTQYRLLRLISIAEHPSLSALENDTGLDRSTLGRNIRVLAKAGHVRIVQGEDARETLAKPTQQGLAVLEIARQRWDACQKRIEHALGDDLNERLQSMLQSLETIAQEQPER
jgi:DNA-binding MarR family transcriptional regulator